MSPEISGRPCSWETLHKPTHRSRRTPLQQCINTCCIYLFATAAAACIAVLILALLVVRVRIPTLRLTSIAVTNLTYGLSPYPFMNATLIAEITIQNPNFGRFRFEETNASLIYDGVTAGVGEVKRGYVNAKETKAASFTVKVKPTASLVDVDYFSHDVARLKTMNLSCVAEFRGRVRVLKVFKKMEVSVLNCTMTLNLSSHGVQNLACW